MKIKFFIEIFLNIKLRIDSLFIHPDNFLKKITGVIHVGANKGQERFKYQKYGLNVIWVEALPEMAKILQQNIADFPNQKSFQALLTDRDGVTYDFNVANNDAASSSILDFKDHSKIWPKIDFVNKVKLTSNTFKSFLEVNRVDIESYQSLVLDTQGSELMILKGAGESVVRSFKYMKIEAPDFEAYAGCCKLSDIKIFMANHGFREIIRRKFSGKRTIGNYYDIVFKNIS